MREFSFGAMMLRLALALAMLCGGVIGYGRSRKERPAGTADGAHPAHERDRVCCGIVMP